MIVQNTDKKVINKKSLNVFRDSIIRCIYKIKEKGVMVLETPSTPKALDYLKAPGSGVEESVLDYLQAPGSRIEESKEKEPEDDNLLTNHANNIVNIDKDEEEVTFEKDNDLTRSVKGMLNLTCNGDKRNSIS